MSAKVIEHRTEHGVLAGLRVNPCPFCGERNQFSLMENFMVYGDDDGTETSLSGVVCNDCFAAGPGAEGCERAVMSWNTRGCDA